MDDILIETHIVAFTFDKLIIRIKSLTNNNNIIIIILFYIIIIIITIIIISSS